MRALSDDPTRRCILSGAHGPRAALIRLALGPDGQVAPDLQAKAGGRGAWIAVPRAELEAAVAKGRLKGALHRAFKTQQLTIPDDLAERIEAGLAKAALDRIGLENRGGALIYGTERIADAIAGGAAGLLLSAADAGADGAQALAAKARHAHIPVESLPCGRQDLSLALGRANTVHVGVAGSGPAERISSAVRRWRDFTNEHNSSREGSLAAASGHVAAGQRTV